MRGLKLIVGKKNGKSLLSHPTRVRGLKLWCADFALSSASVAPYAGAWIEINIHAKVTRHMQVAPYAGAWIEI